MANVLITGANRGLGLELVRYLASLPSSRIGKIFATTRGPTPCDPGSELGRLVGSSGGRVVNVHGCDVTTLPRRLRTVRCTWPDEGGERAGGGGAGRGGAG